MTTSNTTKPLNGLNTQNLCKKLNLSTSAIYDRLDPNSPRYDPLFPKPIKLGSGKNPPVRWIEFEVDVYLEIQMLKRDRSTRKEVSL